MLPNKIKYYKKTIFRFQPFLAIFWPKNSQSWPKWRKLAKSKPFDEIFWNLVCRCFSTKQNATIFLFFGFRPWFGRFVTKKQAKIDQKWRKLAKSKPFDEIFWNLVCRCFPTKKNAVKKLFFDFSLFWQFVGQKTAKVDQNEENCQNLNCLIKFSEICYINAFHLRKFNKKTIFRFWHFLAKKQPKLTKN